MPFNYMTEVRRRAGRLLGFTRSPRRRERAQCLFSFMQEPIFVDGLVKILGGVEPDRIHEPGGREVCAEEVGPSNGDTSEVGSPE